MRMNYQDVLAAKKQLEPIVYQTPMLHSSSLDTICKNEVYLKSEHLQKTGAFKIRGAYNSVKHAVEQGATLVTAASSGNHGQAVALAAKLLGIEAIIVIPTTAAACKEQAIMGYGATIEHCGTTSEERIPRAKEIAQQRNGVFIPPYDDLFVMSGQGTIGLEILEQLEDVHAVIVPVGGGGLISGIATAIKTTHPHIKIIGVEPDTANDTYLSMQKGEQVPIPETHTIADGLRTTQPGQLTFPIVQQWVDEIILVSEEEIKEAFTFVLERMKQLIEPSSATTIAALMHHKLNVENEKVVAVISGGNVDVAMISELLSEVTKMGE